MLLLWLLRALFGVTYLHMWSQSSHLATKNAMGSHSTRDLRDVTCAEKSNILSRVCAILLGKVALKDNPPFFVLFINQYLGPYIQITSLVSNSKEWSSPFIIQHRGVLKVHAPFELPTQVLRFRTRTAMQHQQKSKVHPPPLCAWLGVGTGSHSMT